MKVDEGSENECLIGNCENATKPCIVITLTKISYNDKEETIFDMYFIGKEQSYIQI